MSSNEPFGSFPQSAPPPIPPVPPASGLPPAPPKKSRWWLWALIGCGGLIVLMVLVVAVGGYFIWNKAKDEGASAISKVTGLPIPTVGKDGKSVTIHTDKGEVELGTEGVVDLPDWVPQYPGAEMLAGGGKITTAEGTGGLYHFKTSDSLEEVLNFYEEKLKELGITPEGRAVIQTGEGTLGTLAGAAENQTRTLALQAVRKGEETEVNVQYSMK
jgi:hypothetical protein